MGGGGSGGIGGVTSRGYQRQEVGLFPLPYHLGGDFDNGKIMGPVICGSLKGNQHIGTKAKPPSQNKTHFAQTRVNED